MKIKSIKTWSADLGNTKPYTIAFKTIDEVLNSFVEIELENGRSVLLRPFLYQYYVNMSIRAVRKQFPIRPAYAMRIHKSQGLTINKGVIDLSTNSGLLPHGLAYVAFSRFRSFDDFLLNNVQSFNFPHSLHVDEEIDRLAAIIQ